MDNPVKPDDADQKWDEYHGHTRAKHNLLKYYLDVWMRILGGSSSKIRVFDCFAGRGNYSDETTSDAIEIHNIESPASIPGSPQIILDKAIEYSHLADIECVFIEKEKENVQILENNLPDRDELPDSVDYDIAEGRFQDTTIPKIENTGGWQVPTFFFIDPFGYSQIEYELITEIAETDQFDILINLMANQVIRWQDVDKHQEALKKPFGTENWREELETHQAEDLDDKEVSYYCTRLEENGPEHTLAYLVTRDDSDAMVYYLVFGTNDPKGIEVMSNAMNDVGPGEFAYAPHRDEIANDQAGLNEFTGNPVRSSLLELFSGEEISFENIMRRYVSEERYSTKRRKDIRSELKEMEQEGIIEVTRITSKTEQGLSRNDIIHFPEE